MKRLLALLCLGVIALGAAQPLLAQQTGTLVFDLKNYTFDGKETKKIEKGLEHAGIPWRMLDNTLLISFVNQKYVNADAFYLTRFGEQKKLEMKAGEYSITCIGFELNAISTDPDKSISKNGFFNNDVLKFTVLPGKTTTLEISPVFEPESKHYRLAKLKMYIPDLKLRLIEDGTQRGDDVVINRRTDKSVAWDDYKGPLKN